MSHLLPTEKLEEQLPKLLPGVLSLYKKHAETFQISKVSADGEGTFHGGPSDQVSQGYSCDRIQCWVVKGDISLPFHTGQEPGNLLLFPATYISTPSLELDTPFDPKGKAFALLGLFLRD